MEAEINVQLDLHDCINKARINFKKSPKERITVAYLETRLEGLEKLWDQFAAAHQRLVQGLSPSALAKTVYGEKKIYDSTDELYLDYKCELKTALNNLIGKPNVSSANLSSSSATKTSHVKLPKITIPTFSGLYTEWMSFRDLFVSLIHDNTQIDDVQKLHYLKTHLKGEAEQLLHHIPITNDSYEQCWNLLKSRYSNKQYLVNNILRRFFGQKNIVAESSKAIKELLDIINETLNALLSLGIDTSSWDVMIIYIVSQRLDTESRKQWEAKVSELVTHSDKLPTIDQFKEFLETKYHSLEFLDSKPKAEYSQRQRTYTHSNTIVKTNPIHMLNVTQISCTYCKRDHNIRNCKDFITMDLSSKRDFVQNNGLCFNCLGGNHSVKHCRNTTSCQICNRRHHSLLHPKSDIQSIEANASVDNQVAPVANKSLKVSPGNSSPSANIASHFVKGVAHQVLLATAVVKAESQNGGEHQLLRALIDQGSQASFITTAAVQLLGLKTTPTKGLISGLGGEQSLISKSKVEIVISSRLKSGCVIRVSAYVLDKLTAYLPANKASVTSWPELEHILLADPEFHVPNKIDILLGAEVYSSIIDNGIIKCPSGSLVAQNTTLGWILSGKIKANEVSCNVVSMHTQVEPVDQLLRSFWEVEAEPCNKQKIMSIEEQRCEDFYQSTTTRDEEGRYVVKLPFRDDQPSCAEGQTRVIALKRFHFLERKLKNNPHLKKEYKKVINEYLELNHMKQIEDDENKDDIKCYYFPHHAVVREDKETSKVRLVFDASCKGINGVSLNDDLMVGPSLQPELRHIIMRWRMYYICFTADIVKMYRQVKVDDVDTEYQRVLWRDSPDEDIKDYKLLRVTFGTSASPYLAVKSLIQIAKDEGANFPLAAERVQKEFYMDDLMSGCETENEAIEIYKQMNELLKRGGFELQKWTSNSEEILKQINEGSSGEKEKNVNYTHSKPLTTNLEEKAIKTHLATSVHAPENDEDEVWSKFSSLTKLLRVIAYCRRFLKKQSPSHTYLLKKEIDEALVIMIKKCQNRAFTQEIRDIQQGKQLDKKSVLASLNPQLDELAQLRVGGRLHFAEIEDDQKHPIILPKKSHLTDLIIRDAHKNTLHGAAQLMMNFIRAKYYIIGLKSLVKLYVNKCVTCIRFAATNRNQLMGQLPSSRVTISRAFLRTGVDYAGPINIRVSKGRGNRSYKGYICLFICMATRGIHLEAVSDLTSQGFLAAFKRFVARRGHCSDLYSDNGSNFVGASRELKDLFDEEKSRFLPEIADWLATNGTQWHFIPPYAPNFGGLWEAGVKSCKFHLKRVIGNSTLTFEEMTTILAQIECCLNSRPMSYIQDQGDPMPLTPGHFLVGESLLVAPDRNYEHSTVSSLRRWQFCQRMLQDFWRRWSQEYLTRFMQRYKWAQVTPEPNIGDVVLVKELDLPPARWLMGQIVEKHPGVDNVTRVVTLRYKNTLIKRPVSKLCVLPLAD